MCTKNSKVLGERQLIQFYIAITPIKLKEWIGPLLATGEEKKKHF